MWCASCGARACDRVDYGLCDPREQFMFFAGPRTGIMSAVQLSSATFSTQKVCQLLLQIARLLSKVKVSKLLLFAQLFAPIKSVHEESCEISLQTFTFFATFCSHKQRCKKVPDHKKKRCWPAQPVMHTVGISGYESRLHYESENTWYPGLAAD